jgi:hypothetical protein
VRAIAVLLTGAVALGVLTGCSADPADDAAETEPTPTASVEPTPTTPPPVHAAVVTTPEEQDAAEAAGMAVYEKPDGTLIALDPAQPLPPELYADMIAQRETELSDPWGVLDLGSDGTWLDAELRELARKTGPRHIVVVEPEWGHPASLGYDINNAPDIDDPPYLCWIIRGDTNLMPEELLLAHHDQAVRVAQIQEWVDTQPASENWEMIVFSVPATPRPEWGYPPPPGF